MSSTDNTSASSGTASTYSSIGSTTASGTSVSESATSRSPSSTTRSRSRTRSRSVKEHRSRSRSGQESRVTLKTDENESTNKSRNPFLNFMRAFRREFKGMTMIQSTKEGSKAWRLLSLEEKNRYKKQ